MNPEISNDSITIRTLICKYGSIKWCAKLYAGLATNIQNCLVVSAELVKLSRGFATRVPSLLQSTKAKNALSKTF